MIRAAFFGSNLIAGTDLHDPADRLSTVVSRILGWEEVNFGLANSRIAGRTEDGRIVDPTSAPGRVAEVVDARPDVVVLLFGEEDFASSALVGERRIGLGLDSVASIPAVRHERRHLVRRAPSSAPRRVTAVQEKPGRVAESLLTRGAVASPGTFAGDFDYVLSALTRSISTDRIYVVSPPFRPSGRTPNSVGLTLANYSDTVRAVTRQQELAFIDAYRESTIQPLNFDTMSEDGETLNARGHQHAAAFLIERLIK